MSAPDNRTATVSTRKPAPDRAFYRLASRNGDRDTFKISRACEREKHIDCYAVNCGCRCHLRGA